MCSAKFPIVCKDNPLHQKGFVWECQSFLFHWKIFFFHSLKAQLSVAQKNLIFAIVMLSFKLCIWRHTNYIKGCLTICKQFLKSQYLQLIFSKITRVRLWRGEGNLKFFLFIFCGWKVLIKRWWKVFDCFLRCGCMANFGA